MTKVKCDAVACKYIGNDCECNAKEISLFDLYVKTIHGGSQHVWKCRKFEDSSLDARVGLENDM